MTELSPVVIELLEAERETLNARFALRQRGGGRIDPAAFLEHLQRCVAPLVERVQAYRPERARGTLVALYDASLDLCAASLLGREAKMPWVQKVWTDVLPAAVELLARDAQQVAGSLSNAIFQVASQRGTRPEVWLKRMRDVVSQCQSTGELLDAGKVAAWQAGMVQIRGAALTIASQLRPQLASAALGRADALSADELTVLIGRLREQPWLTVEAARRASTLGIAAAATVGAFTGFGGEFSRPPLVFGDGERLLVTDGQSQWELLADAYGAWLRRSGGAIEKHPQPQNNRDFAIDNRGTIRCGPQTLAEPQLANATSFVGHTQTLAVTIATSHHVFLYSAIGDAA